MGPQILARKLKCISGTKAACVKPRVSQIAHGVSIQRGPVLGAPFTMIIDG